MMDGRFSGGGGFVKSLLGPGIVYEEQRGNVAFVAEKAPVGGSGPRGQVLVSSVRVATGAMQNIFHGEHGHGGEHILDAVILVALEQEVSKGGIEGKFCHVFPVLGNVHFGIHGPEGVEQLEGLDESLGVWGAEKVKGSGISNPHSFELQDDVRQINA